MTNYLFERKDDKKKGVYSFPFLCSNYTFEATQRVGRKKEAVALYLDNVVYYVWYYNRYE